MFPISTDSGPASSDGLERLPPPKPPPPVPEKPPVVVLDERFEPRLLDPVTPPAPARELEVAPLLELLEDPPAPEAPPSTNLESALVATGIKSTTGMYLSSRLRKLST